METSTLWPTATAEPAPRATGSDQPDSATAAEIVQPTNASEPESGVDHDEDSTWIELNSEARNAEERTEDERAAEVRTEDERTEDAEPSDDEQQESTPTAVSQQEKFEVVSELPAESARDDSQSAGVNAGLWIGLGLGLVALLTLSRVRRIRNQRTQP